MNEHNKGAKSGTWQRKLLITICVILSVILVLMLSLTIAWKVLIEDRLNNLQGLNTETLTPEDISNIQQETDSKPSDFTGPVISGDEVDWGDAADLIENDNQINIMLIGQDRRKNQGRQRSDAMILCTINTEKKTITLTSFMRDMYVQIPGYRNDKMNAAYQIKGMPLLDKCLEKNFGIQVDGNIEVDFGGFIGIVDILGGIDMELTASEASYLNRHGNWGDDSNYDFSWRLKEGMNHLSGEQALAYSRIRYIKAEEDELGRSDSDFGRTSRQRRVLGAIVERVKKLGLGDIDKALPLMDKFIENVATDLDTKEIISLAKVILPMLEDLKIVNLRIPADGTYYSAWVDDKDVLVPDMDKNNQIIRDALG